MNAEHLAVISKYKSKKEIARLEELYTKWPYLDAGHFKTLKRVWSPQELLDILFRCKGNLSMAARECNVTRVVFTRWLKTDGNYGALDEIDETWTDVAESVVNKKIEAEDLSAAMFRLKTKGKGRGYVERTEIDTRVVIQVNVEDS